MWFLLGMYSFDVGNSGLVSFSNDVDFFVVIVDVVCFIYNGLVIEFIMVVMLDGGGMMMLVVGGFYIYIFNE